MVKVDKYKLSLIGEFVDKSIETEFLCKSIGGYSKTIAFIALIFGVIGMLFLGNDYYAVNIYAFLIIAVIRVLFFIVSISVFFMTKKITKHTHFIYLITAYEAFIAIQYLFILGQYDSLSYLSVFGLIVVSLAIYILPNKILFTLIISVLLSISFFLYPAKKIEGLEQFDVYKIMAYQIILIIYCNINAYLTNTYKRKQFVTSRELLTLSVTDSLTGIFNRAKFDEEIERWVNFSTRYDSPLSIILIDIDDFKVVNDNYGHLVGDKVLKDIVETINNSIRNTDVFARWGGEEFVILLPHTDISQAEEIAERIRNWIRNNMYDPVENITCSFGVATLEKDDTSKSLILKADKSLYQAKSEGKDRVTKSVPKSKGEVKH